MTTESHQCCKASAKICMHILEYQNADRTNASITDLNEEVKNVLVIAITKSTCSTAT
jgi:hypothetical protein